MRINKGIQTLSNLKFVHQKPKKFPRKIPALSPASLPLFLPPQVSRRKRTRRFMIPFHPSYSTVPFPDMYPISTPLSPCHLSTSHQFSCPMCKPLCQPGLTLLSRPRLPPQIQHLLLNPNIFLRANVRF